jgi:uncharacterized iron-regulated membrane protein
LSKRGRAINATKADVSTKTRFRKTHCYIGLFVGFLAAAIGLTGSLLILHDFWRTYLFPIQVTPIGKRLSIDKIIAIAQTQFPHLTLEGISYHIRL